MPKNALLGAALAVVLLGVGFVAGRKTAPAPATPPAVQVVDEDTSESISGDFEFRTSKIPPEKLAEFLRKGAPSLRAARKRANRMAAHATLRNIISAQAQFQAAGVLDRDQDGVGEYGGFSELAGNRTERMDAPLNPPVLSGAFRLLTENGEATRSGYHFRIYLSASDGAGLGESQTGFTRDRGVLAETSETTWCIYAWPTDASAAGTRVYFTNQMGDVLMTEAPRYVGSGNGPKPDAAFKAGGTITGEVAVGVEGQDGNVWGMAE